MSNKLKVGDIVEHVHGEGCQRNGSIGVVKKLHDPERVTICWITKTAAHDVHAPGECECTLVTSTFKVLAHAD